MSNILEFIDYARVLRPALNLDLNLYVSLRKLKANRESTLLIIIMFQIRWQ